MPPPQVTAIVPMKPLAQAKMRLAPALDEEARRTLSRRLLKGVLISALRCPAIAQVWVVGGDPCVRSLAEAQGATWLGELGRDLNETLWLAFQRCFDDGAAAALFLPGDLPLLQPQELKGLIAASGRLRSLVLVPAARDSGTNAMLVPRALAFPPLLGKGSFQRHLGETSSLGYPVALYHSPGLALDVDTLEDLRAWQAQAPEAATW